jgi:small-conductance mechanosensitive channel
VQRGPLAHSRADVGVQNSLITLLGYGGLVIALFASISALGVDLGNLALIAGALSVGIGFGLQSIVNNFVSGLILLFERPIKVGDWIVTTSGEGTVKKISVRSTEIETFDRSSIIVPNSELVSSTVTNWTHKDKIGRISVAVGVSYGSDPEKVRDILLKCANAHPLVVAYPEPFVVWKDFGASSLDFELRAFLNDISKGLQVRTDLRFAIFKALADAGIEIPFPQTDIHIKSMPKATSEMKGGLDNA